MDNFSNKLKDSEPLSNVSGIESNAEDGEKKTVQREEKSSNGVFSTKINTQQVFKSGKEMIIQASELSEDYRVPVPEVQVPAVGHVKSLSLKQLLCGIIAGGVAGVITSPFDKIRAKTIAEIGGNSTWQVFVNSVKKEGIQSVLKGSFSVSIASTAVNKGFQFWAYESVKRSLQNIQKEKKMKIDDSLPISTIAGACGGCVSSLVSYPFDSLLDRFILEPKKYKGFTDAVLTISKKEGVQNLYRGVNASLLSMAINSAITFHIYDNLQDQWKKKANKRNLSNMQNATTGAVAAAMASFLSYPLECVRKEINMSAVHSKAGKVQRMKFESMAEAMAGILKQEGWRGFYKGVGANCIKNIPMVATSFVVYELCKRVFIASEEEKGEVKG